MLQAEGFDDGDEENAMLDDFLLTATQVWIGQHALHGILHLMLHAAHMLPLAMYMACC